MSKFSVRCSCGKRNMMFRSVCAPCAVARTEVVRPYLWRHPTLAERYLLETLRTSTKPPKKLKSYWTQLTAQILWHEWREQRKSTTEAVAA